MNRLWIVFGLVTAVSCFAGGFWIGDRKEPVEHTVYKDRVVVQHSEKHDDISTVTKKRVTKPNGQVTETEQTVINKSVEKHAEIEREKTRETTKVAQAQYGLGLSYQPAQKVWGVGVSRRLVGGLWGTAQVDQRLGFQLGIRVEF